MIALILARGGSKRVPGKNIKTLNGIPLIGHVIIAANKSKLIEKVYVSTDDAAIKKVAESYGAIVIDRPDNLSEDYSTDIEAFVHFIEETGYSGNIVHLRATTPLLDPNKLDEGIEFFLKHEEECHSMRSAHEMPRNAYKCFEKHERLWKGMFDDKPGIPREYYNLPNQSLPKTYAPNGYIDIVKTDVFKRGRFMHGDRILSFETEFTHEVDTQEDFDYIEYMINKNNNDLFSVKDKVIIVTGASKGIGKAVAEALVESGAIVYGVGTSFENEIEGNFHKMKCDVTDFDSFKLLCDNIFNWNGRINGMVNNAGVTYTGEEGKPYPEELWDKTLEINLKSVFKNTQYVCELMNKSGKGSVVNLTSLNASFGFPNNPAYQASKGGLRMLTKSFARDWGRKGIRFNNIVPGLMVTRLTQASHDNPVTYTQRRQNMMLGRWGQPEDIVGPCIFLLSEASGYMTGQDIYVDGGWSANGLPFLD